MQIIVYKTELIIRKNPNKKIKNLNFYFISKIFKFEIIAVNIYLMIIFKNI